MESCLKKFPKGSVVRIQNEDQNTQWTLVIVTKINTQIFSVVAFFFQATNWRLFCGQTMQGMKWLVCRVVSSLAESVLSTDVVKCVVVSETGSKCSDIIPLNDSPQTHCFLGFLTTGHTKTKKKKKQGCCSDFVTSAGPGCAGLVGTAGRASDRQVRFPGAAMEFSPRVGFQCRLSNGVRTALVCNRMHEHQCAR